MVYRSKAVIALTNTLKAKSPLPVWVEEQCDEVINGEWYTVYVIDSIKWYPEINQNVKAVEDWFSKVSDYDDDYGAIILGENFGDITYHGTPSMFYISPIQSISIGNM